MMFDCAPPGLPVDSVDIYDDICVDVGFKLQTSDEQRHRSNPLSLRFA